MSKITNDLQIIKNNTTVTAFFKIRDHYDYLSHSHITDLWWWLIDGDDFTVDINRRKLVDACFDTFNDCTKNLKGYLLNHLEDYLYNWDDSGSGYAVINKDDLKEIVRDEVVYE